MTRYLLLGAMICDCAPKPLTNARDAADANDTGRTLAVKDEADRALLRQLPHLPTGAPHRVGGRDVVLDAPYVSASGRTCRTVRVFSTPSSQPMSHLACTNGQDWFFVPEVFAPAE